MHQIASFKTTFSKKLQLLRGHISPQTPPWNDVSATAGANIISELENVAPTLKSVPPPMLIIIIISYPILSYHILSYHIISFHIISFHTISYHIISYHIISYHIISYHFISYPIYHIISKFISIQGVQECSIPCFRKNSKNIKSTMSLIIILVIECLICAPPTVKNSFTYIYPLRCDTVSLKNDE